MCSKEIIVAHTDQKSIGRPCPSAPDWFQTVDRMNFLNRARFLLGDKGIYSIQKRLAVPADPPAFVKLIISPALIRDDLQPLLRSQEWIAIFSVLGAMVAAFVFSSIAFRPLGKLGHMLDLIARGEYEIPVPDDGAGASQDEFNAVASKVSMLGQKLQGAQTEFSDLKTNVERLLEELEDAVLIFARDRRLIAAVGSVERFVGRPRAELLNQTINEIFPPGSSLGLFLAQAMQTGRMFRNRRVPLSAHDGNQSTTEGLGFALLSIESLESSAAGGLLVRLRDPEATRQIGRQLQTADRLSAISRLTKGVAHEVKNPLNAILMHVELARMKLAHEDYDLDPQMDVISTEILRLDRVVKTFLDFTRPVELNLSEYKVAAFMDEIISLARPQAQAAGIEIIETVEAESGPADDAIITIDIDLMKQAVLNIVVNAIEAMPEGGTLRFDVSLKGDDTEIRIADTGGGIPQAVKERIYDLYFTTKQHGSGIGLAMTFRIVQLHDATIDFVSEPGHGTTFVLRLPAAMAA